MSKSARVNRPRAETLAPASAVRAKVFSNGRSQAVRLPKQFRFDADEVSIRRDGDAVILEPVRGRRWPAKYWAQVDKLRRGLKLVMPQPIGARLLDIESEDDR